MNRLRIPSRHRLAPIALLAGLALVLGAGLAAAQRPLTFVDLMKFRAIQQPVIADTGTVVAYGLQPDRGDGEGVVHALPAGAVTRVPRGAQPVISKDGRWVAMVVRPPFAAAEKPANQRPKSGMAIVDVAAGAVVTVENVDRFAFSDDSRWLAWHLAPPEPARKATDGSGAGPAQEKPADTAKGPKERKAGGTLVLRELATGRDVEIPCVSAFAFDPASRFVAYAVADASGKGNGVFRRNLGAAADAIAITASEFGTYADLSWTRDGAALAFTGAIEREEGKPTDATIWTWNAASGTGRAVVTTAAAPAGWTLPFKNDLAWTRDGRRLFFGFKPADPAAGDRPAAAAKSDAPADPYDTAAILQKVELDVWHWNDPRINSAQKKAWSREKDRTYRAVLHADTGKVVPLADLDMPDVAVAENGSVALGSSDVPYLKETTWGEGGRDYYAVNLASGARTKIVERLEGRASLSPDGRYVAYFRDADWHLYDVGSGTARNVTAGLGVAFADEEHDTPNTAPAYGLGGWVDQGSALLVYDRFDVWQVPAAGGPAVPMTGGEGRRQRIQFRVVRTDPDADGLPGNAPLLLAAYHEEQKNFGFWSAEAGKRGVARQLDEPRRFRFLAKAAKADTVLYTRESYTEFPDLWVSDAAFRQPAKVSNANPQAAEFGWGTAELVSWSSLDGVPLQGVLIKPAGYQPGTRYPVIVYFYERQSQRLYEWNETVVNHRPSFPVYAGAGYAIFLPDTVFDEGHPGQSFLKCLVPGVQKLIDMGVADPKAIGLHGHSWGGYGTAYLVTQTKMFAAAVAGAPVANMTSAYGGIRWESGVARQFQYEKTQSRIGGSLWEYPERYIENSALFFADRVTTPLLLEHGDEDGAVPWYQSIELYLALRRLNKPVIFLEYRGEPHHPQKYPNKLDYSIKMKEFFDHYLKGAPAPDWMTKGVPYSGK